MLLFKGPERRKWQTHKESVTELCRLVEQTTKKDMKESLRSVFSKISSTPPFSLHPSPWLRFYPSLSFSHLNKDIQCITTKRKKMSSPSPLMAVAMATAINLTVLLHSTLNECLYRMCLCPYMHTVSNIWGNTHTDTNTCIIPHCRPDLAWRPKEDHLGIGSSFHPGN